MIVHKYGFASIPKPGKLSVKMIVSQNYCSLFSVNRFGIEQESTTVKNPQANAILE